LVRTDPAGNIKPDKEKSTERIDGAVALIMALIGQSEIKGVTPALFMTSEGCCSFRKMQGGDVLWTSKNLFKSETSRS